MLVTSHLLTIQSMMELIQTYRFLYGTFLELLRKSYFIPVRYNLDRLLASTNQASIIFVHNKFGVYDRLFPLIKLSINIYRGKPFPSSFIHVIFFWCCFRLIVDIVCSL